MTSVLRLLARPFAVAFGCFILFNAALALKHPRLPVTDIWLDPFVDEPGLSIFAAGLGVALLTPHAWAARPNLRPLLGGTFLGFAVLAGARIVSFYSRLFRGEIRTDLPLPLLSLFVCSVLLIEARRVVRWKPRVSSVPAPARVFFRGVLLGLAFVGIMVTYIVSFGRTDFRQPADAAVIFGAKVFADGTPCGALVDRLETGIEAYRDGLVDYLIMTGARSPNGQDEPLVMARYALERQVPAANIILDRGGRNTRASAANCRQIADYWGFTKLLAVSQYFHCARVQLAFDREQLACRTVPTCSRRRQGRPPPRLSREGFFLLREAIAFPVYWLFRG